MENIKLSVKEYYNVLKYTSEQLLENPDDDDMIALFADAAYVIAAANLENFIPDDLCIDDPMVEGIASPEEVGIVTGTEERE